MPSCPVAFPLPRKNVRANFNKSQPANCSRRAADRPAQAIIPDNFTALAEEIFTMVLVKEWTVLATDIRDTALRIFDTANVPVTMKGFSDEKVLALTLL